MKTNSKSKEEILRNALNSIIKDLRVPLSTIVGMSDLLLEQIKDDEQLKRLKAINHSSEEIHGILNNVRGILVKDIDRTEIVLENIARKDFIKRLESTFNNSTTSNEVSIDVDVKIPNDFETDPDMLIQALLPLVKSTEKLGKGGVTISLKKTQESQHWCYVRVNIRKEKLAASTNFEKLFRERLNEKLDHLLVLDSLEAFTTKLNTSETENHLDLTFYIKLHYTKPTPQNQISTILPEAFNSDAHVLIVEDNELNQLVTKLMVESFGCTVDMVKNGKEAIDLYNPNKHDCIFMDIEMPIMNGIEATKNLREKYGEKIPIIGLSADAMGGDIKKHKSFGFSDYLIKPVKKETLGQKIYFWTTISKKTGI